MAERKIYHSIAELVGETPLVEVTNYEKEHDLDATILAKLEFKDIPGVPELIAEKGLAFDPFYDLLQKYADEHGWYYINQGRNPENPNVHIATTGPEIWDATGGNIDYLVALVGTGGSLIGIGKYLKEKNPDIQIVGAQPAPESLKDARYPERNTLDGVLTFDNVPKERIIRYFNEFDFQYDEVVEVNADLAYEVGRDLVRTDGIFLGQSAAAAIKVATDIAKDRKQRERRSLRSMQTMHSNIYRRIFTDNRRKLIRS